MSSKQLYHLTYDIDAYPDGLDRDDVHDIPGDVGACDAIVIVSILRGRDGSYSQKIIHLDGSEERPLHPEELFKAWALWADALAEDERLGEGWRELAALTFNSWRRQVITDRDRRFAFEKHGGNHE